MSKFCLRFFAICFLFTANGFCQTRLTDSLEQRLITSKEDTQKVMLLHELCKQFLYTDSKKSLQYGRQAYALAEKLQYKKGSARALHNIGIVFYNTGGYDSALYYFSSSLKLKEKIGDKKGMASSYNNMGAILSGRGDYNTALDYYQKSLKIYEELRLPEGAMSASLNVGNILSDQHNHEGALKYYRNALAFALTSNDLKGTGDAYLNIGSTRNDLHESDSAFFYYKRALGYYLKGEEKERIATTYNTMGNWYKDRKRYDSALVEFQQALKIHESLENKEGVANTYHSIGVIYFLTRRYDEAKNYFTEGLNLAQQLDLKSFVATYYEGLSDLWAAQNNYLKAYQYHRLFYALKDSLLNKESLKQIADMNTKYETEKKEQQIILLNKDKEIQNADLRRQQFILFSVAGGLCMAIGVSIFILRSWRITRKQKVIIEKQKQLVEEKRLIVEEKNKDIIDSINYAKRIQLALLKEEDHVNDHLPEHFILFKPKDIVSGDFYWAIEKDHHWYLAAADCTGHGVPGGFMSMLGIAFLNEIVNRGNQSPAAILDQLRERIVKELGQKGKEGDSKDGMDISLVRMDMKTFDLQWAGANNPLYLVRNKDLHEVKANKQPIGYHSNMQPFTNHTLQLQKGDSLYLFTDGFADQFGGPKGKKYKYSKLKELVIASSHESMSRQKEILTYDFENWKSNLEQTDDVCVIGVRI